MFFILQAYVRWFLSLYHFFSYNINLYYFYFILNSNDFSLLFKVWHKISMIAIIFSKNSYYVSLNCVRLRKNSLTCVKGAETITEEYFLCYGTFFSLLIRYVGSFTSLKKVDFFFFVLLYQVFLFSYSLL